MAGVEEKLGKLGMLGCCSGATGEGVIGGGPISPSGPCTD